MGARADGADASQQRPLAEHGPPEHGPLSAPAAARDTPRVALVTCARLPGLDSDDHLLRDALTARGVAVDAAVWDDESVDWSGYALAVLRSPWDYPARRDAFTAWAAGVPRLANPADVIAWNTDKVYLRDLDGIPVVPTTWVLPGEPWTPPAGGEWVVKPTVSAGSVDTGRYDLGDAAHRHLATTHVARIVASGRTAMVQPYLAAVDTAGETALVHLGGRFSHAIRKGPMLDGPDVGAEVLYLPENITPREPSGAELALAERVLAAVPGGPDRLLYARVDLVPGPDGEPVLLELELTEPSLFLTHAPGAADRLADAVLRLLT